MESEWEKDARRRKREREAEEYCSTYVNDLPLDSTQKGIIKETCKRRFIEQSPEQKIMNQFECITNNKDLTSQQFCMGHKTLNPASKLTKSQIQERISEIANLEVEALKAPDEVTELEFREWALEGISRRIQARSSTPPDFKKQHDELDGSLKEEFETTLTGVGFKTPSSEKEFVGESVKVGRDFVWDRDIRLPRSILLQMKHLIENPKTERINIIKVHPADLEAFQELKHPSMIPEFLENQTRPVNRDTVKVTVEQGFVMLQDSKGEFGRSEVVDGTAVYINITPAFRAVDRDSHEIVGPFHTHPDEYPYPSVGDLLGLMQVDLIAIGGIIDGDPSVAIYSLHDFVSRVRILDRRVHRHIKSLKAKPVGAYFIDLPKGTVIPNQPEITEIGLYPRLVFDKSDERNAGIAINRHLAHYLDITIINLNTWEVTRVVPAGPKFETPTLPEDISQEELLIEFAPTPLELGDSLPIEYAPTPLELDHTYSNIPRDQGVNNESFQRIDNSRSIFHAPNKVVKVSKDTGDESARKESQLPPVHTITIAQKFGMVPCDKASTVTPTVFSRFEKVANHLIRAGVALPDDVFEGKGLTAAKSFYNKARDTPAMDALWQWRDGRPLQLNERAWRCAAQHAYFALRDYKTRLRLLHHFIGTLQSLSDISLIFDAKFPQNEVFNVVYSSLPQLGMKLTKGQVSRVYLGNVLRWMRNLVKRGLRAEHGNVVASIFNSQPTPPHLAHELARWLTRDMPKFLKSYLNNLSRRLTGQVKRILKKKPSKRTLPKTKQGAVIRRILRKYNLNLKKLNLASWGKARKKWRDETKELLEKEFKTIDVATLANRAVQEGQAGLTPERVLNLLFSFRPHGLKVGTGKLIGFENYLVQRAITELEYRRIYLLKPHLAPTVQQTLTNILTEPRKWLKLPHFQKQTIPFGADDTRVCHDEELKDLYILTLREQGVSITEIIRKLLRKQKFKRGSKAHQEKIKEKRDYIEKLIEFDEKNNWFERVKKRDAPIRLQLRLQVGNPVWFELRTPKRFLAMLKAGYSPQKVTLLKKRGGKLILAIPFEKDIPKSQCLGRSDLPQTQDLVIAGLDPGLKTWAVLSIGIRDKLAAGLWGQAGQEVARHFYDQKQFGERRAEWFKPLKNKVNPPDYKKGKFPNLKRRLRNLRQELRRCQRERDEYRNACRKRGIDHRHKKVFWRLNSAVKRIWENLSALHDELTRQIATCILAACEHHRVNVIRMEDLRWSKHSKKTDINYFLALNQIHWFFGQIQARIADLAPRKGIFVEWVKAKHTSSRCSKCGHIGMTKAERKRARRGKVFKCPKCGFQLDADLNAARNIRVAPISKNIPPSLYALGGGSPYIPPAGESLPA